LERRLAEEEAACKELTTDLLSIYGVFGALLGWFILDPIAAVMGGFAGVLLAYFVYRCPSAGLKALALRYPHRIGDAHPAQE
jgi:hypothetical protein